MRVAVLLVILPLVLSGCRKKSAAAPASTTPPTLVSGLFVNSPGNWWAPHGSGSFQLEVSGSGNSLRYKWLLFDTPMPSGGGRGSGGSSPIAIPPWPPDWFIYVEEAGASKHLWFYGSNNRLWFVTIRGRMTEPETVMIIDEKGKLNSRARRQVPADLIPRLPAELQKLFPEIDPSTKQPSF